MRGGVVFVHDVFEPIYPGAKAAVYEFCSTNKIPFCPLGDGLSVVIMKGYNDYKFRNG